MRCLSGLRSKVCLDACLRILEEIDGELCRRHTRLRRNINPRQRSPRQKLKPEAGTRFLFSRASCRCHVSCQNWKVSNCTGTILETACPLHQSRPRLARKAAPARLPHVSKNAVCTGLMCLKAIYSSFSRPSILQHER